MRFDEIFHSVSDKVYLLVMPEINTTLTIGLENIGHDFQALLPYPVPYTGGITRKVALHKSLKIILCCNWFTYSMRGTRGLITGGGGPMQPMQPCATPLDPPLLLQEKS